MSQRRRRIRRSSGISLPELLVVIAILALGVTISVPLIATRVHAVKLQAAVSQYVSVLRAARMIAVSRASTATVTVHACPIGGGSPCENSYEYIDTNGAHRSSALPPGVRFGSGSCPTIAFSPSGAAAADCTTVIERPIHGEDTVERYVVHVPLSGIPRVVHDPPG
jgi:prepilin-type N-terminal cleavage/methylation domain-containing protein